MRRAIARAFHVRRGQNPRNITGGQGRQVLHHLPDQALMPFRSASRQSQSLACEKVRYMLWFKGSHLLHVTPSQSYADQRHAAGISPVCKVRTFTAVANYPSTHSWTAIPASPRCARTGVSLPWCWIAEYGHVEYPVVSQAIHRTWIIRYQVQRITGSELVRVGYYVAVMTLTTGLKCRRTMLKWCSHGRVVDGRGILLATTCS